MSLSKWDRRFLEVAHLCASWSKDPEEGVGAVIVSPDGRQVSWGYNGFPRGLVDTYERLHDRDEKLRLTLHAELNALLNRAVDVRGWTLYCTKAPCSECAKALIQAGIVRLVCIEKIRGDSHWATDQMRALNIMAEAHIEIEALVS